MVAHRNKRGKTLGGSLRPATRTLSHPSHMEIEEPPLELPYDDESAAAMAPSLAARIQGPKVYLLEESAAALHARLGKVRRVLVPLLD